MNVINHSHRVLYSQSHTPHCEWFTITSRPPLNVIVLLFGSHATGTTHPAGDIDIAAELEVIDEDLITLGSLSDQISNIETDKLSQITKGELVLIDR